MVKPLYPERSRMRKTPATGAANNKYSRCRFCPKVSAFLFLPRPDVIRATAILLNGRWPLVIDNKAVISAKKARYLLSALLLSTAIAATAFYAYVHTVSERYLSDVVVDHGFAFDGSRDASVLERGRHIARTRGCFGCHGQQLEGRAFSDEWIWVDTAVAPNLAVYAREHDAAAVEAAVRQGVGHDGKALWSMPSYNYALLNDEDMAALITFLRSAPVVEKSLPDPSLGWDARMRIVRGEAQHMAEWADRMPPLLLGEDDDPALVRGEYTAKTTCNECHGFDLRGQVDIDMTTPDLAILAAYSDADFFELMRTGAARNGRENLGLMTVVAKDRFAHFTEQELEDLLIYLRTLPAEPIDHDAPWRQLR